MEIPFNKVHYLRTNHKLAFDRETGWEGNLPVVSAEDEGTTTCGKRVGGMLFGDLTVHREKVTCQICLASDKLPLDMLSREL